MLLILAMQKKGFHMKTKTLIEYFSLKALKIPQIQIQDAAF